MQFSLGLVSPEGRKAGYETGFDTVHVGHEFKHLGIGKTLARNAISIFRGNGDTKVRANTKSEGSYFWPDLGFLPTKEDTDLNDDEGIFSEWEEKNHYMSHDQLCGELEHKVSSMHDQGLIDKTIRDQTLGKISRVNPSFIWKILGIKAPVRESYANEHPVRMAPLGRVLMDDTRISTFLDTENPQQMERFNEKTGGVEIDKRLFGRRASKYIATERERYEDEERYGRLFAP